jgi:hypothetical protein
MMAVGIVGPLMTRDYNKEETFKRVEEGGDGLEIVAKE